MSKIEVDEVVNQTGDNDSGFDLSTNDQVDIKTANTTRVRVDSSGRVGIGATSVGYDLEVRSNDTSDEPQIVARNIGTGDSAIGFQTPSANNAYVGIDNSTDDNFVIGRGLNVGTNPSLSIDTSGNLMVGKTSKNSPGSGLVLQDNTTHGGRILFTRLDNTSNQYPASFYTNSGTGVGSISTTSTNTSFNTSSDYRLKENIVTDWDATSRLKQLKPSRFNFKIDKDTTLDGFLAHEVSSIVPEAITGTKDDVDKDGKPEYQGIDQSKLVPLLTKALQEAVTKIETLEAKVTALEGK